MTEWVTIVRLFNDPYENGNGQMFDNICVERICLFGLSNSTIKEFTCILWSEESLKIKR